MTRIPAPGDSGRRRADAVGHGQGDCRRPPDPESDLRLQGHRPLRTDPRGIPLTAAPEARALVKLTLAQSELGTFVLEGLSGFFTSDHNVTFFTTTINPLAAGVSPTVARPDNAALHARLAGDPALRERMTVEPVGRRQTPVASPAGVVRNGTWRATSRRVRISISCRP